MINRRQIVFSAALTGLAIFAGLAWWQAFGVTLAQAVSVITAIDPTWTSLIFVCLAAQVALSAIRWSTIEAAIHAHQPTFELGYVSGAIAMALGTIMPAPLMSVLCRSLAAKLAGNGARRGAISGSLDQACDLAICVWFAIPAFGTVLVGDVQFFPQLAFYAAVIGLPLAILAGLALQRIAVRWLPSRGIWLVQLGRPRCVLIVYLASVARVGNLVAMAILVSFTSATVDSGAMTVAVPIVAVANALAMMPGAFGVSEWSFSSVLLELGIAEAEIVSFLLANRVILTALPLLLGVLVVVGCALRRWCLGVLPTTIGIGKGSASLSGE